MDGPYNVCPKCGADLWKCYNEEQRKKAEKESPNKCFCFTFGRIKKRDVTEDEFVEKRKVKRCKHPIFNTSVVYEEEADVYRCHVCGKEYEYPEILYA